MRADVDGDRDLRAARSERVGFSVAGGEELVRGPSGPVVAADVRVRGGSEHSREKTTNRKWDP